LESFFLQPPCSSIILHNAPPSGHNLGGGGKTKQATKDKVNRVAGRLSRLRAAAAKGTVSRIVPELKPGADLVTTRGRVHWVVTEFDAVNLHGKTLRERGEALISVAHPDFRMELRKAHANITHFVMSRSACQTICGISLAQSLRYSLNDSSGSKMQTTNAFSFAFFR
jgi:Acetyl-CoA hydrolase/transferase C-terminal domain